jgi:YidC/Oxa1 family membrane protein insertase
METQRLILFVIFSFSLVLLWDAWQREQRPPLPAASAPQAARGSTAVPSPPRVDTAAQRRLPSAAEATASGESIEIRTDLYVAHVNTLGGTLERLELLRHRDGSDSSKNLELLGPRHLYTAQSGLTGEQGPNHRTLWKPQPGERALRSGTDALELHLRADRADGVSVEKVYTFRRGSYVIDVNLQVRNGSSATVTPHGYFQLTHDGKPLEGGNTIAQQFGAQSFLGFAAYTAEKKFEKIDFSDVDKGKAGHIREAKNGWIGFVQHYFVSAWIPADGPTREFVVERRSDGIFAGRLVLGFPALAAGESAELKAPLYAGPQEERRLQAAAHGLDRVVDYGLLDIIARPLFWLLDWLHSWTGNWGVAIILLTVIIKLVFFPLSAASYRSMAKMKLIHPRLMKLRETYGNDRVKLNQAMMELYKTEKINPLGGCFPILVQIPVFIALYWVLLAAIELRHAPFMLWINDLSALDPYFVLPTLMAVTMVIQTRMNPKPPDPVQAKVMAVMPYVFSVFFYFFPAGLVLYWLVNNVLSILQQWQIQRLFEQEKPAAPKR